MVMFILRLPQFIPAIIITVKYIHSIAGSKKEIQPVHQTSPTDVPFFWILRSPGSHFHV